MMQIYINNRMGWEEGGERNRHTHTRGRGHPPTTPQVREYYTSAKINSQLHAILWMSFTKTEARYKKNTYFDCIFTIERIGAIKQVFLSKHIKY